jgi:NADH-quinone oxidoreductase subunit J
MIIATYTVLGLIVFTALWTVITPTPLRAAIGLALVSAFLTVAMFLMDAPLAGAFELSVCAGLITVVFISTISLTRPKETPQLRERGRAHIRWFLPLILVLGVVGAAMWHYGYTHQVSLPPARTTDVRQVLWQFRRLDLLGQILIIFVGVFGVVILFKEERKARTTLEEAQDRVRAITGSAAAAPQAKAKDESKEAA